MTLQDKAELAIKKAVRQVVAQHKKDGRPLAVWENGKVKKKVLSTELDPNDICEVDDSLLMETIQRITGCSESEKQQLASAIAKSNCIIFKEKLIWKEKNGRDNDQTKRSGKRERENEK